LNEFQKEYEFFVSLKNFDENAFWYYIVKKLFIDIPTNHGRDFIFYKMIDNLTNLDNVTKFRILLLSNNDIFIYINNLYTLSYNQNDEIIEKNKLILNINASIYESLTCVTPCIKTGKIIKEDVCIATYFDETVNEYKEKSIKC
jgi:hypothetical protein